MTLRRIASLLVLALLTASVALASGEAHEGGHEASVGDLLLPTINFVLFLWIIARWVMPGIRRAVRDRRDTIVAALEEAERAKAAAERMRQEWQERLAQLEHLATELRGQAVADAERDRERILAAAHKTAEAIRRDAERAAAYEVRRTQQLLRAELVRRALSVAEGETRTKWTAGDQQRSIDEFLAQVQS